MYDIIISKVYDVVLYTVYAALIVIFGAVGCLNNDRTVMSKPYAWRPLGLLPILKATALTNNNLEWQRYRRLDLYHRCMDIVVASSINREYRAAASHSTSDS